MALTAKREAFVINIVRHGMSQREAYRAAYNATNMSDAVVDVKACELMKDGKVTVRFEELQSMIREAAEKSAVASAVEVLEELTAIAMGRKEYETYDAFGNKFTRKPTVNERTKALELVGKHHSAFTDKVQHSGSVAVNTGLLADILDQVRDDSA